MWVGLFSDIHANREAFEATLAHARRAGISRFIFLGDYVGYGADPGFAVDTVMREVERGAVALLGNHDDAIASGTGGMNAVAAEALDWTRLQLNSTQRDFLARLPLTFEDDRATVRARQRARAEILGVCHQRRERFSQLLGHTRTGDVLRPRPCSRALSAFTDRKDCRLRTGRSPWRSPCSRRDAGSPCSAPSDNHAITIQPPATALSTLSATC